MITSKFQESLAMVLIGAMVVAVLGTLGAALFGPKPLDYYLPILEKVGMIFSAALTTIVAFYFSGKVSQLKEQSEDMAQAMNKMAAFKMSTMPLPTYSEEVQAHFSDPNVDNTGTLRVPKPLSNFTGQGDDSTLIT